MDINEALKITGFVLCEFKWAGDEECSTCGNVQPEGDNVYYERTCHDSDEGEYHCEKCTIEMPARWEKENEGYDSIQPIGSGQ